MSLPSIAPTGAMASGEYVQYMITYLGDSISSLEDQVGSYLSDQTATDWYNKWVDILDDLSTRVSTLNENISDVQAKIMMVKDTIRRKQ